MDHDRREPKPAPTEDSRQTLFPARSSASCVAVRAVPRCSEPFRGVLFVSFRFVSFRAVLFRLVPLRSGFSVPSCAGLFRLVPLCSMLFRAESFCSGLFRSVPSRPGPCRLVPLCSVSFRVVLFRVVPFRPVPFRPVPLGPFRAAVRAHPRRPLRPFGQITIVRLREIVNKWPKIGENSFTCS